jgi:hypothetical protein
MPCSARLVTRADPAWFDCGDPMGPDYGLLFLQPAAFGAVACWFDRAQRRFAMTAAPGAGPRLGETARLHGRAFRVADWTDAAKADPAALAFWRRCNGQGEQ